MVTSNFMLPKNESIPPEIVPANPTLSDGVAVVHTAVSPSPSEPKPVDRLVPFAPNLESWSQKLATYERMESLKSYPSYELYGRLGKILLVKHRTRNRHFQIFSEYQIVSMEDRNFVILEFAIEKGLLLAIVCEVTNEYLPADGKRAKQVDLKDCDVSFWLRLRPAECSREMLLQDVEAYSPPIEETRRRTPRFGVQNPSDEEKHKLDLDNELTKVEKKEKEKDTRTSRKKKIADAKLKEKKKENEKKANLLKKKEGLLIEKEKELKKKEGSLKKKERDFEKTHAHDSGSTVIFEQSAPVMKAKKLDTNQRVSILNLAQESETLRHERELESIRHDEQERAIQSEWRDILHS